MSKIDKIFAAMRATQMNDWVGGTDPEAVGDASAALIREFLPIDRDSKVLDFGCGIGRSIVSLLKSDTPATLVGMDIMPPVIEFCDDYIKPAFPFTKFELVDDSNAHYDQFIGDQPRKSKDTILDEYADYFSDAYAFSVFTHIDRNDFQSLLEFVGKMLAPGARFLFTCFALTGHSRMMIEKGQSIFPFQDSVFVDGGSVFWGNKSDPLAFIAFDRQLLEEMVRDAGLAITKVHYGCWMGGNLGASLQDVFIVRKPFPLLNEGEIAMTPVVDRSTLS